jgi:hypothetical protein
MAARVVVIETVSGYGELDATRTGARNRGSCNMSGRATRVAIFINVSPYVVR